MTWWSHVSSDISGIVFVSVYSYYYHRHLVPVCSYGNRADTQNSVYFLAQPVKCFWMDLDLKLPASTKSLGHTCQTDRNKKGATAFHKLSSEWVQSYTIGTIVAVSTNHIEIIFTLFTIYCVHTEARSGGVCRSLALFNVWHISFPSEVQTNRRRMMHE